MTPLRTVGCILAAAVCSACVPVVDSYHGASASEGRVEGGKCDKGSSQLGPPSRMDVNRGTVHIIMDGSNLSGSLFQHLPLIDSGSLDLEFQVPGTSRASFDRQQLVIHDHQTGSPVPFDTRSGVSYLGMAIRDVPDDGSLDAQALVKARPYDEDADDHRDAFVSYKLYIHIPKVPDDLDLHIPALTVDGTAFPPIDVEFKHAVGAYCNPFGPVLLP